MNKFRQLPFHKFVKYLLLFERVIRDKGNLEVPQNLLSLLRFTVVPKALALWAHVLRARWVQTEPAASGCLNFGQRQQISLAPAQRRENQCFCCVFSRYGSLAIHRQVRARGTRHCQIHRHRNSQTGQRDCLLSLCYCDRSVILWGVQSKQTKPASFRFAQQLTVLGCCLHTKSDMKSNSFCPRKSSGSS